ncbi:uncharacterized protein LOC116413576 isoform X2 [Galleria mellonella]|uniref:Uncharacterized protein LOC116413576 isoform X2 n=1 Tax=Galleria mellonella TaxID=7137 RepID=A0ABM3MP61_GALME|nr:uncharacterized protein LOC116413576 isoform X2 [Galleria mellonella]
MAAYFYVITFLCMSVSAAPPAPPRLYPQPAPAQLQQINPYDYYLDNPEVGNYYNQIQQKQGSTNGKSNGAPSRLENLEPDSEVELLPGAQQPQQPPQQNPVSPNLPGLVPGQRVFIVHMPVPGYRPGTIGGYQPVYIVAAAPQGNTGFPGNGYQNAILLDPSGQSVISPVVGYPRQGVAGVQAVQAGNPGLLLGSPLGLNRPFDLAYQEPVIAYQPGPAAQGVNGGRGAVRLSQYVSLQGHPNPANPKAAGNGE